MQIEEANIKTSKPERSRDARWHFVLLCCLPLLGLRIWMLVTKHNLYDFITYWASGRIFLAGGHPYSQDAMLATEQMLGWPSDVPMMTFCPPWALPLSSILALFPFHVAQMGWFAISLVLNCASAVGLWIYFDGKRSQAWIALIVCATFLPMGGAELLGQINPLMLASLTAFLLFVKGKHNFAAGLVTLGFGFKPHLLYLVALAILLWAIKQRAWTLLGGVLLGYIGTTVFAQIYNPNVADYLHRSVNDALEISCGLGWVLRAAFGVQRRWLQFLPCFFGLAWFLYYWKKHREHWDWQTHFPLLVLVSVSTSPYFWFHDFIMTFPALISLCVRGAYRSFNVIVAYLVFQAFLFEAGMPFTWMAVASVLWTAFYWYADRETSLLGRSDEKVIPRNRDQQC